MAALTPVPEPAGRCLSISRQVDVERACRLARQVAGACGLGAAEAEAVVLATSELAMNLLRYATAGQIQVGPTVGPHSPGVELVSRDRGPGIANIEQALQDGNSTGGGLGSGLAGVGRLMDEFEIESDDRGTWIVARKWNQAA